MTQQPGLETETLSDMHSNAIHAVALEAERYRGTFHLMPIALWLLDASEAIAILKPLKAQAISDFPTYLDEHPEVIDRMMHALRITEVNEAAVSLFGARDAADLIGPVEPLWVRSRHVFRQAVEARYRGDTEFEAETILTGLDGRQVNVLFRVAYPLPLAEQGINLCGAIDISDRVRAEEMLRQAQSDLAHAARIAMLGELTASIAHEVNQPLTTIMTGAEASLRWLSLATPDIDEVRTLTNRIIAEARRAADVLTRIRGMAKGQSCEHMPLSLNAVISEAVGFLRHELQAKQIDLSLDLDARLPSVTGDRVQLQQVVVNLIMNAMQAMAAMEDAPREIVIGSVHRDDDGVCVTVDDNGPGIAAEDADQLFRSFFTTKSSGMGLGLPICRSIVEAHGGRIGGTPRPGPCGARFRFVLPPCEA